MAQASSLSSNPTSHQPPSLPLTGQARSTFQASFSKFEKTVNKHSKDDGRDFSSTDLKDVWKAAREIEQQLAARQCLRNVKRIEPLLEGLERYSKVIEVLCNGTPYLPWIWAPIKLMLKLASDHINAFEKLISAYSQIAEFLPRFDRLSNAFRHHPDFQRVVAVIYSDILEFHRCAYKFFRKTGWKCFFKSTWGRFDARFSNILESLSRHANLVDQEANALLIDETMRWREEAVQEARRKEKERLALQLTAVLTWLNLDNTPHCGQSNQEVLMDRLMDDCYPRTTDWILSQPKLKSWLRQNQGISTLWLKGKPGSGKSTICARIARFLQSDKQQSVLYCFYTYHISSVHSQPSVFIHATLLSQILRQNKSLSTYIYVDFVSEGLTPSLRNLKQILHNLFPRIKSPRILIDGIDECIRYDHLGTPRDLNLIKDVLRDILELQSSNSASTTRKLLLVSRDVLQIVGMLSNKPTFALEDEKEATQNAIRSFTHQRLVEVRDRSFHLKLVDTALMHLEDQLVNKAQGMFLWLKLVLMQLEEDVYSPRDLENVVAGLPYDMNDFYARIIARIRRSQNPQSQQRALHILQWMSCSRRPLRKDELQNAILHSEGVNQVTSETALPETVLGLCKPLIQILSDGTVVFVHFTVQEYLTKSRAIDLIRAESNISVACISYLCSTVTLLHPPNPMTERENMVNIGKGFYSLSSYAHEHWFEHLLSYASKYIKHPSEDVGLSQCLRRLQVVLKGYQTASVQETLPGSTRLNRQFEDFDPHLVCFERSPDIHQMLSTILRYREHERRQFGETSQGMTASTHLDPTPFKTVNTEYNRIVQILLSADAYPGLTSAELDTFKSLYGPSAFACRFPGCSNSKAGFPTDELRNQHEKIHAPPLLCTISTCTYTLSFGSTQALRRHIRDNHYEHVRRIPKSVRNRSVNLPSSSGHNSRVLGTGMRVPSVFADNVPETRITSPISVVASVPNFGSVRLPPISAIDRGSPMFAATEKYPNTKSASGHLESNSEHSHGHHQFLGLAVLGCHWCNHSFATLQKLKQHEIDFHAWDGSFREYPSDFCTFCDQRFGKGSADLRRIHTIEDYISHIRARHALNGEALEYEGQLVCFTWILRRSGNHTLSEAENRLWQDKRNDLQKMDPNDHPTYGQQRTYVQAMERYFSLLKKKEALGVLLSWQQSNPSQPLTREIRLMLIPSTFDMVERQALLAMTDRDFHSIISKSGLAELRDIEPLLDTRIQATTFPARLRSMLDLTQEITRSSHQEETSLEHTDDQMVRGRPGTLVESTNTPPISLSIQESTALATRVNSSDSAQKGLACLWCETSHFTDMHFLIMHEKTHRSETFKDFSICHFCGETIKTGGGPPMYLCHLRECSARESLEREKYSRHLEQMNPDGPDGPLYGCRWCYAFITWSITALISHEAINHIYGAKLRSEICPFGYVASCNYTEADSPDELRLHLGKSHGLDESPDDPTLEKIRRYRSHLEDMASKDSSRVFCCGWCIPSPSFPNLRALINHEKSHHHSSYSVAFPIGRHCMFCKSPIRRELNRDMRDLFFHIQSRHKNGFSVINGIHAGSPDLEEYVLHLKGM